MTHEQSVRNGLVDLHFVDILFVLRFQHQFLAVFSFKSHIKYLFSQFFLIKNDIKFITLQ